MQSIATLDAVISPEWDYRYYSFDSRWCEDEMMGSMRNGSGDSYFVLFNSSGAFIKGFDHERWNRDLTTAEAYRDVPSCFSSGVSEPAFSPAEVTFCYWRKLQDDRWYAANLKGLEVRNDGSEWMISELDGDPASYLAFARSRYKVDLDAASVSAIYDHDQMTPMLANSLNPSIDYSALTQDLLEIGYPIAID